MDTLVVFLVISVVLFFGFLAEYIFKKTSVPDVLLLIALGLLLGKYGLDLVHSTDIQGVAPVFITFTLLFLLYDGAFKIDLASFTRELGASLKVAWFNFLIATGVISVALLIFGIEWRVALLVGFALGGISSAFTIPMLKQLNVSKKMHSILTLESAFTDVMCIVFALTMMDLIQAGTFSMQSIAGTIVSLFAVAGFIGAVGGVIWVFVLTKILGKNIMNMITIAFLLVVYVITEYLGGNGAIAGLFFGIVLKNSIQLQALMHQAMDIKAKPARLREKQKVGISVTTENEEEFYNEIAFFMKTLFFVYIGILLDFSDPFAVIIGATCAVLIMFVRPASNIITPEFSDGDKTLMSSMFARGIAGAAIMQIAMQRGIPQADFLTAIVLVFVLFTILFSSTRLFFYRKKYLTRETG